MVFSFLRFLEVDVDGSLFLRKDLGKEMLIFVFEFLLIEVKIVGLIILLEKERCEVFEESGDDIKIENFIEFEVNSFFGVLLVSFDCVMTLKFEVFLNILVFGYVEKF